jgi:hypothetical protein
MGERFLKQRKDGVWECYHFRGIKNGKCRGHKKTRYQNVYKIFARCFEARLRREKCTGHLMERAEII